MDYGSADYDDGPFETTEPPPLPTSAAADGVSLWLVFGVCVILALVFSLCQACWRVKVDELSESLVTAVNDSNDDDEEEKVYDRRRRMESQRL